MNITINLNDERGLEKLINALKSALEDTERPTEFKKDCSVYDKYDEHEKVNAIEDFDEEEPEKIFGAGFEIDEPRACDYDDRGDFLYAHELYDKFVEAGEACVAAGLARDEEMPIVKCNAFKKNVGDLPPIGVELIGETQWE